MIHKAKNSDANQNTMGDLLFFRLGVSISAIIFMLIFGFVVLPEFFKNPDIIQAFAGGFTNPFASGYSSDVIACWAILCVWIIHEARSKHIKHGWLCLVLGVVPGVAVGFALYLLLREQQLKPG